jgi:hypothetical protein
MMASLCKPFNPMIIDRYRCGSKGGSEGRLSMNTKD